jgi:hypothetical protein
VRALLRLAVEEEVLGELRRGRGESVAEETHAGAMVGSGGWSMIVAAGHSHGATTDVVRTHQERGLARYSGIFFLAF